MWNDSSDDFARVIRFENLGFNIKPYNSTTKLYGDIAYIHSFPFFNIEVTDIELCGENLPIGTEIVEPAFDDIKWGGCFVFLEHYDPDLFESSLHMKRHHKKNVALLSRKEKVWVRNTDYSGKKVFQFHSSQSTSGKHYFIEPCSEYAWVLMTVDDALERIRKGKEHSGRYPEELTEVFLMERQIKQLINISTDYKYMSLAESVKNYLQEQSGNIFKN